MGMSCGTASSDGSEQYTGQDPLAVEFDDVRLSHSQPLMILRCWREIEEPIVAIHRQGLVESF